jgi:hypothetical protein
VSFKIGDIIQSSWSEYKFVIIDIFFYDYVIINENNYEQYLLERISGENKVVRGYMQKEEGEKYHVVGSKF